MLEYVLLHSNYLTLQDDAPSSSLLDEVLQAFTEIYAEPDITSSAPNEHSPVKGPPKPERSAPTSPKSPMIKVGCRCDEHDYSTVDTSRSLLVKIITSSFKYHRFASIFIGTHDRYLS